MIDSVAVGVCVCQVERFTNVIVCRTAWPYFKLTRSLALTTLTGEQIIQNRKQATKRIKLLQDHA